MGFLNNYDREDSNYDSRLETVKIYLKLKQLMIEIDDVDESSDEEGNKIAKAKGNSITAKLEMEAKQLQRMNRDQAHHHHPQPQHKTPQKKEKDIEDDSDRDTDGEEKKVDTLTACAIKFTRKRTKRRNIGVAHASKTATRRTRGCDEIDEEIIVRSVEIVNLIEVLEKLL